MFPLSSVAVVVVVVGALVMETYYLRPSRGRHANPDGAAVSVAVRRLHHDSVERQISNAVPVKMAEALGWISRSG